MNGLLKRPASPTTSDSSKENIDEEDNNNMNGLTRWGLFNRMIHGRPGTIKS